MPLKSGNPENFWQELKRRKVVRVTTVYAATAFIILQLVDIIAQPLQLPSWTLPLIIVLLSVGLIITVIVSWIYDITPKGVRKTKPVGTTKSSYHSAGQISGGWKITTLISIVIIVALVAFNLISRKTLRSDISKLEKSVAVLPFMNESPVDSNKYFINGIMEEVLNNLQKIRDFRVLSRTSTDQYKSSSRPTIPEIARKLNVNYIVEGSGQKYGNKFVLRVQLIAANNERHLWARSFEKEIKVTSDLISIQSEIAQSVASELNATITPEEKQQIEKIPTRNLTAYDFYQRGRDEYKQYSYNIGNRSVLHKAEDLYKMALKYDSKYAQAYAGLAWVYWDKHFFSEYFSDNFADSVLILTDIALSFNDKLAEAYNLKGTYYNDTGNPEQAIKEFEKAIKFNPNDWSAYFALGDLYSWGDDLVKSIDNFHKAASLNHGAELPGLLRGLSFAYSCAGLTEKADYYSGEAFRLDGDSAAYYGDLANLEIRKKDYAKAIDYYWKIYALDTNNIRILIKDLGYNYMNLGKHKESLECYVKGIQKSKATGITALWDLQRIGYAYWKNGKKKEADYYFDKHLENCLNEIKLGRLRSRQLFTYYDLAGIYAFRGEKEKAYENLRIYNKRKKEPEWTVELFKTDPLLDNLRAEPEFQQILKDVDSKYQAEHERVMKWLEEKNILY